MNQDAEEQQGTGFAAAIPTILWQRRWFLIVPLVLATLAGIAACLLIKPVYSSEATVLIESQDVPVSFLDGPVADAVDQRIARARQRVLSRMELIRLIRAYALYGDEQRTTPLSKIVDKMRADTTIQAVNSAIAPSSAKKLLKGSSTIALTIGFRYSDATKAQTVAQQFVNRFLEFDASTQAEQAVGAANFLQDQAADLQAKIAKAEDDVRRIKVENGAVLALGLQGTGDPAADAARMDGDIIRLQAENASLASSPTTIGDVAGVGAAESALRVAQARYSDTHPDVVAAKAQLASARSAAAALRGSAGNPAAGQMAANNAQINALRSAKTMLLSQSGTARAAQARAPGVVAQAEQLETRANELRQQYAGIGAKLQSAQISARMETEQKGERLTLADPPVVPDRPLTPNRPAIMLTAIMAGGAAGLALILLIEFLMRPLRGPAAVAAALGEAPLAVIADLTRKPGFIVRYLERRTRRKLVRA